MSEILYTYGDKLYINLTNRCPCRCTFCIRSQTAGLGSADSLWLEHDPSVEEVLAAFSAYDLSQFPEVVFCGYGEPFCALEQLLEVCRYLRSNYAQLKIRINTNGLGDLIQERETAPLLEGLVDSVSISLNAPNAVQYTAVTRPVYGTAAFDALLRFAASCKAFVPNVQFTIVDVLPEAEIQACKQLAERLGIPLRIRHFSEG